MKIGGLPVKDLTKKMKIKISKADCEVGKSKDPGACAAARACKRLPSCTEARVHIARTYLKIGKKWLRCLTPDALRSEIIAFDRGGSFAPGEYELLPPSKYERLNRGKAHSLGAPKHGRPGHHRKLHVVVGVRQYGANR
jgi:hypothetical protein